MRKQSILQKWQLIAALSILFCIPCIAQTNLYFDKAFKSQKKYVFETSDVIFFSAPRSGGESNLCNNRSYRVRDNEVIIQLVSTPASAITIYASSTGSKERTVRSIEVSDNRKNGYTPVTCKINSTVRALNKGCGTIELKGLSIPKGSFVKIYFGENTNISEFEIQP